MKSLSLQIQESQQTEGSFLDSEDEAHLRKMTDYKSYAKVPFNSTGLSDLKWIKSSTIYHLFDHK